MYLSHEKSYEELIQEIRSRINPRHLMNSVGTFDLRIRKKLAEVFYESIEFAVKERLKYNLPCNELIMSLHDLDTLQLYFTDVIQGCDTPWYIRTMSFGGTTLNAYICRYNEMREGTFLIR